MGNMIVVILVVLSYTPLGYTHLFAVAFVSLLRAGDALHMIGAQQPSEYTLASIAPSVHPRGVSTRAVGDLDLRP
jgi:hypothetical protein